MSATPPGPSDREAPPAPTETKNIRELGVRDLRRILKARNLSSFGVKAVLVTRLQQAIIQEGGDPDNIEIGPSDVEKKPTGKQKTEVSGGPSVEAQSSGKEGKGDDGTGRNIEDIAEEPDQTFLPTAKRPKQGDDGSGALELGSQKPETSIPESPRSHSSLLLAMSTCSTGRTSEESSVTSGSQSAQSVLQEITPLRITTVESRSSKESVVIPSGSQTAHSVFQDITPLRITTVESRPSDESFFTPCGSQTAHSVLQESSPLRITTVESRSSDESFFTPCGSQTAHSVLQESSPLRITTVESRPSEESIVTPSGSQTALSVFQDITPLRISSFEPRAWGESLATSVWTESPEKIRWIRPRFDCRIFSIAGLRAPELGERVFTISIDGSPLSTKNCTFVCATDVEGETIVLKDKKVSREDLLKLNADSLESVEELSTRLAALCRDIRSTK